MFKSYIPILLSSTISLAAIMALVALIEPALFVLPGSAPASVQSDSLSTADTTLAPAKHADTLVTAHPSQHATEDSSATEALQAFMTEDSLAKAMTAMNLVVKRSSLEDSPSDTLTSSERKKMAKIFEAMDPESAARILYNMDDRAVKDVLSDMKPRQSAKILSALDPKQAARILKGNTQ